MLCNESNIKTLSHHICGTVGHSEKNRDTSRFEEEEGRKTPSKRI
jgi:hypothetical protein